LNSRLDWREVAKRVNADRNGERVPVEKGSTSVRSYLAA